MFGLPTAAGVVLIVAVILLADVAVFLLVVRPWMRRRLAAARDDVVAATGGRFVLHEGPARSLGEESRGRAQVRGSGYLAVDEDEIVFALMAPRRTLRIPREAVTAVDEVRSHLGKWVGRPLLKVSWTREDGVHDAVAFDVATSQRETWRRVLAGG